MQPTLRRITNWQTAVRALGLAFSLCLLGILPLTAGETTPLEEQQLFESKTNGYASYRIPSIIATKKGTLLAFCEGRVKSRSDSGDIDVLLRRSTDNGKTWSEQQVVWSDEENTCGNPCPVVDESTGTIWLLLTWNAGKVGESGIQPGFGENSRRVFVTHSTDDGVTWSEPQEITQEVKKEEWSWYATGPGAGIQIQRGKHQGRLVIPCDHKQPVGKKLSYHSHVIYSDDHGKTWELGGRTEPHGGNECEVVELQGGKLMLNMRNYDRSTEARLVAISEDGGETWSEQKHDPTLIEPVCQASIRRIRWEGGNAPGVLMFSNPASTSKRENLTIRASYDDGQTWPYARTLHAGPAAYSCLVALPDNYVGCLYESENYKFITFAKFRMHWVWSGKAENE